MEFLCVQMCVLVSVCFLCFIDSFICVFVFSYSDLLLFYFLNAFFSEEKDRESKGVDLGGWGGGKDLGGIGGGEP